MTRDYWERACQDLFNGTELLCIVMHLGLMLLNKLLRSTCPLFFSEMNETLYVISLMLEVYCSSSVYVEGDIETRVYNDGINGEVKNIPEICIRHDGIKPTITVFFFSKCLSCKLYFFILQYLD